MAPQGAVCILGARLHPTTALLAWLAGVVACQYLGYAGLGLLLALLAFVSPALLLPWLRYVRRARWLLLTLWLILAYNTPGEAFHDLPWAPTEEGIAEASLQAARLVAMLAMLAWLFVRLGRDGLVGALWGLLRPFARCGLDTERLVVRLSLVLDNLQVEHEKGAWKKMLAGDPRFADGPNVLHLDLRHWHGRDALLLALVLLGLCGAVLL